MTIAETCHRNERELLTTLTMLPATRPAEHFVGFTGAGIPVKPTVLSRPRLNRPRSVATIH